MDTKEMNHQEAVDYYRQRVEELESREVYAMLRRATLFDALLAIVNHDGVCNSGKPDCEECRRNIENARKALKA